LPEIKAVNAEMLQLLVHHIIIQYTALQKREKKNSLSPQHV
jgi:hypothetical protein